MNRPFRIIACALAVFLTARPALALNDTITVTVGTGTTKTANLISFTGGNVISEAGICDPTTANQCASVSAGGLLSVAATLNAETVKVIGAVNQGTSPWAVGLNTTPTIANGNGVVPTIAGAVYSATNGAYFNQLQGNAVLSVTNGGYQNILQGNAALSATNGLYANLLQGNAVIASGNPLFAQLTAGAAAIGSVTANAGTNLNTSALATSANQPTNAAQGSTTSGQTGNLVQCAATTAAPSYTTAQTDPLSCDLAGNLRVNVVTATGVAENTAVGTLTFSVLGGEGLSTEKTAVTTGNYGRLVTDLVGKIITMPYAPNQLWVNGTTAAMTGTTSTQLLAAVASNRIYLSTLTCGNSHATVGTFVNVQDGSAGTTIWTVPAAAVYGGATLNFQPPLRTTNGNGVYVADATTGANVICSGSGYSGV